MLTESGGPLVVTDSQVEKSSQSGIVVQGGGTTGAAGSLQLTRSKVDQNGFGASGTGAGGSGVLTNNGKVTIADSALVAERAGWVVVLRVVFVLCGWCLAGDGNVDLGERAGRGDVSLWRVG